MRLLLLQVGIVAISLSACGDIEVAEAASSAASITIPVVKPAPTDTVIQQEYVADIQASKNVEIRAKVQGYIEEILIDEGQEVKKGQPLFVISNAEFKADLSKARAALANALAEAKAAELELNRVQKLVSKKIISPTESELAEARLKAAEAKVAEARSEEENAGIRLAYSYIRSPFNGVIDRIPFKPGSLVDEGTLLTTLSSIETMYAYFMVSEGEYLRYLRAKKAKELTGYDNISLILADGSRFAYPGRVETTASEIDESTGSIAFRAAFPNPDKILKHGASGKILLGTMIQNALIIPQKAVMEIQDKNFVFVVDGDNRVRMKSFEPRMRMDEFVVVQSGLSEHDTIVYEGIQNIRDGAIIIPQYVRPGNTRPGITKPVSYSQ